MTKGMRQLDFKNKKVELDSKRVTWDDMKVPENVQSGLHKLSFMKPSII